MQGNLVPGGGEIRNDCEPNSRSWSFGDSGRLLLVKLAHRCRGFRAVVVDFVESQWRYVIHNLPRVPALLYRFFLVDLLGHELVSQPVGNAYRFLLFPCTSDTLVRPQ